MSLLEHRADIDHRVDIHAAAGIFSDRRLPTLCEKIAQPTDGGARGGRIARSRKGEDPKASIRFDDVAEVNRLGVRETDDRRGMKAFSNDESFSQMLVDAFAGQDRWAVMRCGSRRIASVPDEIALGLGSVGPAAFFMCRGEQRSPFAIEVDQFLGNGPPFRGVSVQQRWRAPLAQNGSELPSQIVRVLHGDVHALPRLWTVGVAGIAGDEHARQPRRDLLFRHVVELVGQPLADLINRPPRDFFHVERIWIENPPRLRDQLIDGDIAACDPFADFQLGELNVEAEEVAAFPRDDDNGAIIGGLDE